MLICLIEAIEYFLQAQKNFSMLMIEHKETQVFSKWTDYFYLLLFKFLDRETCSS